MSPRRRLQLVSYSLILHCTLRIQKVTFSDPGYVSSSLRSQSSEHGGGGVGGVMARVLPRKKKTTVADPSDAWTILKDRQLYRYLDSIMFHSDLVTNLCFFQNLFLKADESSRVPGAGTSTPR